MNCRRTTTWPSALSWEFLFASAIFQEAWLNLLQELGRMRGVSVLLFASLVVSGLSYEVVDEVEGILTAEETKHYNVESSEVLVGK